MARFKSFVLILALAAPASFASQRLLYLEAQAVAGYSFHDNEVVWYSMDQMDAMQKPSIGFDFLHRLSGESGDWGLLAIQARLAYDSTYKYNIEPQLYNAYLKLKPSFGDVWLGHNKPAFGLASNLDNHGTLLQPLSMYGFGYDRDWGAGYYRDLDWGNAALSATLGSGMPFIAKGNYLLSGRLAKGDLNRDNYTAGLSASYGRTLETMGYHLDWMFDEPRRMAMLGTDGTLYSNRWENRIELLVNITDHGEMLPSYMDTVFTIFYRSTVNAMDENRLKLELQYIYQHQSNEDHHFLSTGFSYQIIPDLTTRLYLIESSIVAQLYWYHNL